MAVSFAVILLFGKRLPTKGAGIGIAAIGLCFLLSLGAAAQWIDRVNHPPEVAARRGARAEDEHAEEGAAVPAEGEATHAEEGAAEEAAEGEEEHHEVPPVLTEATWWSSGGVDFTVGTFVDGLSVMMMVVVTLISLLVHVYSTDYVGGDRRYTHYFAFLSLFSASMLLLIMSRSTRAVHHRAGSSSASARSRSSATGGRRSPTPTPPSRRSSPTASATSACSWA